MGAKSWTLVAVGLLFLPVYVSTFIHMMWCGYYRAKEEHETRVQAKKGPEPWQEQI